MSEFCRACGASIPHRPGEGRCPACMHHMPEAERLNQCDGCRRGLPIERGNHVGPGGFWAGDMMGCTRDRYGP